MRQILHEMTDASGVETLGLDGVFHLISEGEYMPSAGGRCVIRVSHPPSAPRFATGAQTMNVDQMLEAHKQLIGEEISRDE